MLPFFILGQSFTMPFDGCLPPVLHRRLPGPDGQDASLDNVRHWFLRGGTGKKPPAPSRRVRNASNCPAHIPADAAGANRPGSQAPTELLGKSQAGGKAFTQSEWGASSAGRGVRTWVPRWDGGSWRSVGRRERSPPVKKRGTTSLFRVDECLFPHSPTYAPKEKMRWERSFSERLFYSFYS